MADRSVAATDTMNDLRREFNGSARDVGDISNLLSASGFIASSTDVIEAILAINTEVPEVKTDLFTFPGRTMVFEGATDDAFETTISFAEPTADRTHTLPNASGTIIFADSADTLTNKTISLGSNTISGTLAQFNSALSDDSFASLTGSETLTNKTFTSPTISAHTFSSGTTTSGMTIGANGIVFEGATADAHETTLTVADPTQDNTITIPNETMTIAGGDNITTSASGSTVTITLATNVVTLTGSQTLENKTFNSPTTISAHTFSSGTTTAGMSIGANGIVFEGATADAHETTLTAEDPTQDNTITIPNDSITCITTATHATKATHIARAIALG